MSDCGCRVWLTPQTVNKPQCLCVSDFVPTPEHDSIQSLVASVNDSIDHGQLKGIATLFLFRFYLPTVLVVQISQSVVCVCVRSITVEVMFDL